MSARDGAFVRQPIVSGLGSFYPSDPCTLVAHVSDMLAAVEPQSVPGDLVALVVPHAGFKYSGSVAAYAYRQLAPGSFTRAVIVGCSHHHHIGTVSVYPGGSWLVPNGEFPVDDEFTHDMLARLPLAPEDPRPHFDEHSLEVQLPFLAETLGQVPIVPLLLGSPSPAFCQQLGLALAETVRGGLSAILIASSDLSHYKDQQRAEQLDHVATEAILTLSAETVYTQERAGNCALCALAAVMTVMSAAAELGANRATLLRYATSGDITGDFDQVVGYTSIALSRED